MEWASKKLFWVGLTLVLTLGMTDPASAQDADGDGVPDVSDLCPDTPLGQPVDVDGCPTAATWVGGASGTGLLWDVPANWSNNDVPDTTSEPAIIDDVLTGDRDITTPAVATEPGPFSWRAHGAYEDKLILGADFSVNGPIHTGWYNTANDPCVMTLDLNSHTFTTFPDPWYMPHMTVIGPGTFSFTNGIHLGDRSPVFDPSVTMLGAGWVWGIVSASATIPNLTSTGPLSNYLANPLIITGDLQLNHRYDDIYGVTIGGDVNVANDPNAGLGGYYVQTGFSIGGDLTDHNTVNRKYPGDPTDPNLLVYDIGQLIFNGGGVVQALDLHRESGLRLILTPGTHVLLAHDYYAPYAGIQHHSSRIEERTTLDVANYDLTVTDLSVYGVDDANVPTFKYTATGDPCTTGSITVTGGAAVTPSGETVWTGLSLSKFKVEIVDGGGWNFGDDFILFDYDKTTDGCTPYIGVPELVDYKLPVKWAHEGLVHDPCNTIVYLDNLRQAKCGDPQYLPPEGDLNGDCYVNEDDLPTLAQQWLDCTDPLGPGCLIYQAPPEVLYMPHCWGRTIDGVLDDWTDPCWIDLDQIYYSSDLSWPNDLVPAKYTVCWDPCDDKFYSAIVVDDTDHIFESAPINWHTSDRVEIYVQADPNGGDQWGSTATGYYDKAQQYIVGYQGILPGWTWAVFGHGTYIPDDVEPGDAQFDYEGGTRVNGNTITYENAAKSWLWYGGRSDPLITSVPHPLAPGMQVGFDVVVDSRRGDLPHDDDYEFGMLSANLDADKYIYAENFQRWELLDYDGTVVPPECGDWGHLPLDADTDCYLGLADFATWSVYWMDCTHPDPPCDFNPWEQ